VVHSSIHPQNATLNEFLSRIPDAPTPLPLAAGSPSSPWKLRRPELLKYIASAEVETELCGASDEMQKLLLFTIDVSKPSLCSAAESSSHFLRIFSQLMRTLVSGNGTPSLLWANPASVIPLRMHAFATLLQIINSVNTYMVRNGCTQLDGKSRWNLTQLGRVVAMAFDEEQLFINFDDRSGEILSVDEWEAMFIDPSFSGSNGDESAGVQPGHRPERVRRRHSHTTDLRGSGRGGATSEKESLGELLAALASSAGSDASEPAPETSVPLLDSMPEKTLPPVHEAVETTSEFKIDSKSDFQSNLWAGSAESSSLSSSVSGSMMAQNMIKAYSGVGPSNRRKWMTAPTSGLATIQEDADQGESDFNDSARDLGAVVTSLSPERSEDKEADGNKSGDNVDTELVLRDPVTERKKMRVPRVTKTGEEEATKAKSATFDSNSLSSLSNLTVPSTDEEIFSAGTAFLDTIGKNLGYRYV